jgi:hypothetical protein
VARHRKIDLRMHGDEKYRRLSPCPPCGQALWWHLLAGRHTGIIPGLSVIGETAFAEQLRWSLKAFRDAFREVIGEGMAKADWDAHVVWVPNAIKYNPPASANVVKSWGPAWDETPECPLKVEAYETIKAFLEGFGKGFPEAFAKVCRKPLPMPSGNQEQEQEQEQDQEQEGFEPTDPSPKRFVPPTVEEVAEFCKGHGLGIDPARFVDHYTANGWKVGKAKMKDWQATARNWSRNEFNARGAGKPRGGDFDAAGEMAEFLRRGQP